MKLNTSISFLKLFFIILFTPTMFIACSDKNKQIEPIAPIIHSDYTTDGLSISLNISVTPAEHAIKRVNIYWGAKGVVNYIILKDFESIHRTNSYLQAGEYDIAILTVDELNNTFSDTVTVQVDFNETSLAGIRENMYKTNDDELLILTINLHTYQETQQNEKFRLVADAIAKLDIDFVLFQECAQNKNMPIVDGIIRQDNMALLITKDITDRYQVDYNFVWDWAHYGWTIWEEGVAILSKHTLLENESRYVSLGTSTSNIESRKIIYGAYQLPNGNRINLFSVHTHWRLSETDQEQNQQIANIIQMADEKTALAPAAFLLVGGDFNANATSEFPWNEAYTNMMQNGNFTDSFLEANPDANSNPNGYNTVKGDFPGRIDYIFVRQHADYEIVDAQILFKPDVIGQVSDHYGVLTKIRLVQ